MARPTSVAGHRNQPPRALFLAHYPQFLLGFHFGDEVVDARLGRNGLSCYGIVTCDHNGANGHLAQLRDALTYSRLQRVRENDDAQDVTVDANGERCCSQFRDSVSDHLKVRWHRRMELIDGVSNDRVHCTFADDPTVHKVDSAHAGLR
jgi:hypothetical protein